MNYKIRSKSEYCSRNDKCAMGVIFTYHVSLRDWIESGIVDREKLIYEEHIKQGHFDKVVWFTFGTDDEELRRQLVDSGSLDGRIVVIGAPRWAKSKMGLLCYSYLLPYLHKEVCNSFLIVKSNQMPGARIAARISEIYKLPFEFRTGYSFSLFHKKRIDDSVSYFERIRLLLWLRKYMCDEKRLFKKCSFAAVSSMEDRLYALDEYGVKPEKIVILTNYIDCSQFLVKKNINNRKNRLLYVGRLSKQKNLHNLIMALKGTDIGLDLYGDGDQKEELEKLISEINIDARMFGRVDNSELPNIYNDYKYYVLPSYYEGMPKTLLEAMACGCICIGTEVEGIKEVIKDGENGFLISSTDMNTIKNKITEVVKCDCKNDFISENAHSYTLMNHSLDVIVKKEWETINNAIAH